MSLLYEVEQVLKDNIDARSSDKYLTVGVWWRYHEDAFLVQDNKSYISVEKFFDLPSYDTISRIRRKLQEQNKYLPAIEIANTRKRKEKKIRKNINMTTWKTYLTD